MSAVLPDDPELRWLLRELEAEDLGLRDAARLGGRRAWLHQRIRTLYPDLEIDKDAHGRYFPVKLS